MNETWSSAARPEPESGSSARVAYRPEVDGLRAIAVMLVVVYHAGYAWLPGGFVGVDVFFVVSGFLITGIVWRAVLDQRFSAAEFYRRRIARLVPALLVCVAVTLGVSCALLPPSQLRQTAASALAVLTATGNVYFWREFGGYFGGETDTVPLLHTWSLAVEEQFYFVWPMTLVLLVRTYGVAVSGRVVLALIVGSLGLSELVVRLAIGASYYLLPTRAFELLVGAAASIYLPRLSVSSKVVGDGVAVAGLVAVLLSARVLDGGQAFPGLNALPVTLGTAAILIGTQSPRSVIRWALSLRPLVTIGRASYSIYLWHWPLAVFLFGILELEAPGARLAMVAASIVIGVVSWRLVEERFRYPAEPRFSVVFKRYFLLPSAGLAALAVVLIASGGLPQRLPERVVKMDAAFAQEPASASGVCHSSVREARQPFVSACTLSGIVGSRSALLVGDSHANHFGPMLDVLAREARVSLFNYTMDACAPLIGFPVGRNQFFATACLERNSMVEQLLVSRRFDFVVLAANWPNPSDSSGFLSATSGPTGTAGEAMKRTVALVIQSGAVPVIVLPAAFAPRGARCVLAKALYRPGLECEPARMEVERRQSRLRAFVMGLARENREVVVLDPLEVTCSATSCAQELGGVPLFLDEYHLNSWGSEAIGRAILARGVNPFTP